MQHFYTQVLWGGCWQDGSVCMTGEEVGQRNACMSSCGKTTKYMLPEGMAYCMNYISTVLYLVTTLISTTIKIPFE